MSSCGFIFVNFDYCHIKPYNQENLEYYKNKILLSKLCYLTEYEMINNEYSNIKLYNLDKKITKSNVTQVLKELYNLDKKHILDYTPIRRKYLHKQNSKNNLSIFIVIIKNIDKFTKVISDHKLSKNSSLMMYDLKSIPENLDVAQSILNYDKNRSYCSRPIKSIIKILDNYTEIYISKMEILKSLRGSITFNDNVKTYILKLT